MNLKSYSCKTHQGPYLHVNEDDVDVDLKNRLYLVFDGFGGSNAGDRAVSFLKEQIKKFYTKVGGDPESTLPFYFSPKYLIEGNALLNSMHYAHTLIKKQNKNIEMSKRGGASAIATVESENTLTLVSTGNCVAYLYRKGHLNCILQPDSFECIAPDNYQRQFYTAPMSGFGLFDDLHLNIRELKVFEDDLVVIMTDGVYARLELNEIKFIIENKEKSPTEKINELFKLSNSRGNLDNQTTLFLQY